MEPIPLQIGFEFRIVLFQDWLPKTDTDCRVISLCAGAKVMNSCFFKAVSAN